MILPWQATCMQIVTRIVNKAATRDEAMAIVNKSLDRWIELITGSARGTELKRVLLFPEFALTGFPLWESADEWIEKACIEIPGPITERLQEQAQKHRIFIGANSYERDPEWPGRYFNCSYLMGPSGNILLKYRRINTVHTGSPHDFMDQYLDKYGIEGTFPVVNTELGKIAMMPCGEIMYPEAARMFMFRGAEVLLHPTSDHGASDINAWESAKKVRASENMMYLVSTNTGGTIGAPYGEGTTAGHSKIIDYNGQVLSTTGAPGESTVASALIDVEGLRRVRQSPGALNRILRQRVDIYRPLYNSTTLYPPNQFADAPMDSKERIMEIQSQALNNMAASGIITLPDEAKPRAAE
jgi:predicted amidohydrolase